MTPAWLPTLTDDEYDKLPYLRASEFKAFCQSGLHYEALRKGPKKESAALRFGTLVHLALLQPELFESRRVIERPFDKRTTAGKQAFSEWQATLQADSLIMSQEEFLTLLEMQRRFNAYLYTHEQINLQTNLIEVPGVAICCDVACKIKPDINPLSNIIVDLKTTDDATVQSFSRTVFNFSYHIQAAFYALVSEEITGKPIDKFVFIAIEKNAPYALREFEFQGDELSYCKEYVEKKLVSFRNSKDFDLWDGYPNYPHKIDMPKWIMEQM